MAMPSGNVVIQDKMQFPSGGGGGGGSGGGGGAGGEIHQHHYRQQWFVDERDGLIGWLRSEFAAANAIIDSLCHHLRVVGDPGEYDMVVGAIQQRRCNWNQVLLMQQYFSVAEVVYALQQVAWRRQQRYLDPVKVGAKEVRKSGSGYRHGQRFEGAKEGYNSSVESYNHDANAVVTGGVEKGTALTEMSEEHKFGGKVEKVGDEGLMSAEEKKDAMAKHQTDGNLKSTGSSQGSLSNLESEAAFVNDGCISNCKGNDSHSLQNQHQSLSSVAKTFIGNEMFDGKMMNVVDGLKLYEDLFDDTEVSKLVSLVNDLRVSGKKGQLLGNQTYVVSRRPMKGHGREMIQLGVPIADAPPLDGENITGASKDMNVESIPSLFQDIIERMVSLQVMNVKPDCCIVDFYNEGDHSQPYSWPSWFGRPVYILSLTDCEMTFGRVIASDHPGDYRGSLKLSLGPGSLLAMQGKSSDFAKHALPSMRKQRILVTFTKSQPKRSLPSDAQRLASPAASSHWNPPPSRSPNHARHIGSKHYPTLTTTGVLPAPPIRPQIAPPNGMQPLFVTAPVVPPMPFPAPVPIPPGSSGWTAAPPPRHPPPRIPAPGTGVFLPPPGSGNPSQPLPGTLTDPNSSVETSTTPEKENGKSNHISTSASPKGRMQRQECNGHVDGSQVEQALETQQDSDDKAAASH
ncbi:RNA demethylase ALKBH10B-like [Abrus precatorius]|uniref:RNA demethylase ALKBH10B-like n=1 Tax=Abrus precatorius TaxID=3816 RepID=A0A8B8KGI2_ABRPR|nr:RNA demethylase ALKBH10B-like [Abrus precatorius]